MPITLDDITAELDKQRRARPDRVTGYRTEDIMGLNDVISLVVSRPLEPGMDPNDAVVTIYSQHQDHPGMQFTFDNQDVYEALDMLKVAGTDSFTKEHRRPWRSERGGDERRLHYGEPHIGRGRARPGEHGK